MFILLLASINVTYLEFNDETTSTYLLFSPIGMNNPEYTDLNIFDLDVIELLGRRLNAISHALYKTIWINAHLCVCW